MSATDHMIDRSDPTDRILASEMLERGDLLTLDAFREELAATEPLLQRAARVGESWLFDVEDEWKDGIGSLGNTDAVRATVSVDGVDGERLTLTKEALLEATSLCGIPKGYASRLPGSLVQAQLNYWFNEGFGDKVYKVLTAGDGADAHAVAVNRESIVPFSNLQLLDSVIAGVTAKYGHEAEMFVDYKRAHSLRNTEARLIIPENTRAMVGTGTDNDNWSIGINMSNSLTGEGPTQLDGYLFRWWCTNGCIDLSASSGKWSRRGGHQDPAEVMEWARASVDSVLGGLESTFDLVQSLVDMPLDGDAHQVLDDIFTQHSVPGPQRTRIIQHMVDTDRMNMYEVMQAITQAANGADVPDGQVRALMEIGGDMPRALAARCGSCRRIMPAGMEHVHAS